MSCFELFLVLCLWLLPHFAFILLQNYMKAVNSRFEEVVQLYEKRQAYFQKTISRYSERPVQRVEPSVKVEYKTQQKASQPVQVTAYVSWSSKFCCEFAPSFFY